MSNRDDIPETIRRMKTSEIFESLIDTFVHELAGGTLTTRGRDERDAMRSELDRRVPPSEPEQR